jgi:hypothetical protein
VAETPHDFVFIMSIFGGSILGEDIGDALRNEWLLNLGGDEELLETAFRETCL